MLASIDPQDALVEYMKGWKNKRIKFEKHSGQGSKTSPNQAAMPTQHTVCGKTKHYDPLFNRIIMKVK